MELLATVDPEKEEEDEKVTAIHEKYDHLLHGGSRKRRYMTVTATQIVN